MKIKRLISGFLATAVMSSTLLFTGCTNYMTSNDLLVTIGDEKITMDTMRPFIAMAEIGTEFTDLSMAQYYAYLGAGSYSYSTWDSEDSVKELKTKTMNDFVEKYIMYKEAIKVGGYEEKITDDILKAMKDNAKALIGACSKKMLKKSKLTEDDIVEYQKIVYIYNAYYEDTMKSFDVKKADVEADVNYEHQYRQYKTTYYSIPLTITNEEDNSTSPISDEEKAKAKTTMDDVLKMLKAGKKSEDITKKYANVASTAKDFTQADAYPDEVPKKEDAASGDAAQKTDPDKYIETAKTLKKGAVSEVFEYSDTYAIAVMDNDNSKEAYDTAIDEAISAAKTEKYNAKLEELKKSDAYKVETDKAWDKIKFGELVIDRDEFDKAEGKKTK